jgi:hypothetical protein
MWTAAQFAQHAVAVEFRHRHVANDQVRPFHPREFKSGAPVRGRAHTESFHVENEFQVFPRLRIVLND